jgi:glycosyltransferase 2 family protein
MVTYVHHAHAAIQEQKDSKADSSKGLWTAFVVGFVLFLLSAMSAHTHQFKGLEANVFRDINNISLPHVFTTGAIWGTEALGAAYPIAACVLVALIFKKFRLAWRFLFTAGGTVFVFYIVKKIINEPRPITMLHGNLHQRVVETGPGFPSGHMAAATALALTLWFELPPKWRWISVLWMVSVAWSRLYLGVHTPADIVGGFAVGLMAVCFVRLLPKSLAELLRLTD